MKKLSLFLLAAAMIVVLAVSASASIVMYQGGAAAQNVSQGGAGSLVVQVALDEPINVFDYDYMFIRFYVDNPDNYMNNGQIEITSSGTCDQEESNWDLNSMPMEQGWNEWKIDLYTAGSTNGMADYEKVNFFRTYFFTDGDNYIALDYVAFGTEEDDFSSIATDFTEEVVIEEYVPEDKISRTTEGESGSLVIQAQMAASPVNISEYDYAFIRVYVEGVDNFLTEGQLELTSKATCDVQEIHWNVPMLGLEDGWNELKLDLYMPDAFDATFNFENCNYFRMYQFTEGYLKMELDYVGFGMEDDVFGEDTLPCYLVKPMSQEPAIEDEPSAEEPPADTPAAADPETPAEEADSNVLPTGQTLIEWQAGCQEAEDAPYLFDGDTATKWCINNSPTAYIIWKNGSPIKATGYAMYTANDTEAYPGRNPYVWSFYGSNDGENWTVLDDVEEDTAFEATNFTPYYFVIDNPAEYEYYKLDIAMYADGGSVFQISEFELLTGEVTSSEAPVVEEEPAAEETEAPVQETEPETEAPEQDVPAEEPAEETEAPAVETEAPAAEGGCGSFIGGGIVVIAAILGTAWVSKRR